MFWQNTRGSRNRTCNTKATLEYASTLKAHIRNQVFELTTALKKLEHEECMLIDQKCREKLQGFEYLCGNGMCVAGCQNLSTRFYDDGFPSKRRLDLIFTMTKRQLQGHEEIRNGTFRLTSEANKNTLVKEQVESRDNANRDGDSEDCFEFVDSVECLKEELHSVEKILTKIDSARKEELHSESRNVSKSADKNSPQTVDDSEEPIEGASCSSVDSFDVIPNECCMNNSPCKNAQTSLPGIQPLPQLPDYDSATASFFPLPDFAVRERNERKEERNSSQMPKRAPPPYLPAGISKPTEGPRVCMYTSKGAAYQNNDDPEIIFSFPGPAQEKGTNASVPTTTEVADDIEVTPSTSEAKQDMSTNASVPTKVADDAEVIPSTSEAKQEMCAGIMPPKGVLGGLFSTSKTKASPAQEMSTNASVPTKVADDFEVIPSTSKAKQVISAGIMPTKGGLFSTSKTKASNAQEMGTNASVPSKVADDVEVIPSTSEAKQGSSYPCSSGYSGPPPSQTYPDFHWSPFAPLYNMPPPNQGPYTYPYTPAFNAATTSSGDGYRYTSGYAASVPNASSSQTYTGGYVAQKRPYPYNSMMPMSNQYPKAMSPPSQAVAQAAGQAAVNAAAASSAKLLNGTRDLIVYFLPLNVTQFELQSLFSLIGEVESCSVDIRTNGQNKGFGLVKYVRAKDAEKAVRKLNGLRLQNKTIEVSYAYPSCKVNNGANLFVGGLPKNIGAGIMPTKGGLFSTSKAKAGPTQEMSANASVKTTTKVADDVEVIPSTSKDNAIAQQENTRTEEQSEVSQNESNPSNAPIQIIYPLRNSLKRMQKQDPKIWVHPIPEPRAHSYEDWLFKVATTTNPLAEIPNGSAPTDVGRAFLQQLQRFSANDK